MQYFPQLTSKLVMGSIALRYGETNADRSVVWIRESRISITPPDIDTAIMSSVRKHSYARASSPFAWGDAFYLSTALNNNAD